jgi:hypothetical protein
MTALGRELSLAIVRFRPEAARDSYKQLALNGFLYFAQIEGQRKF